MRERGTRRGTRARGQDWKNPGVGITKLSEIIYVFLTIFLYLLKCPQSLIL